MLFLFLKKFSYFSLGIFIFLSEPAIANEQVLIPFIKEQWLALTYNKIPANQIKFENNNISIKVNKSAGPLVFKLGSKKNVSSFSISGRLKGLKKIETSGFDEDSILRLGLVAVGEQTLTGPKKWLAADWVKQLFSLAPEGIGLDKIYFYNITNRSDQVGKLRKHPKSDLLLETVILKIDREGEFNLSHTLKAPLDTIAIWISIDGDDSASDYEITLTKLMLFSPNL